MRIRWIAFPLRPNIPDEGQTLEELFAGQPFDIDAMNRKLKAAADDAGLPISYRKMAYNSRMAHELSHWADEKGRADEFHHAVFTSYFVDCMNVGDRAVLLDIVKSLRLPEDEAADVIDNRRFRESVDADWEKSRANRIKAAPTFVFNGRRLVGAQPYEALRGILKKKGDERPPESKGLS